MVRLPLGDLPAFTARNVKLKGIYAGVDYLNAPSTGWWDFWGYPGWDSEFAMKWLDIIQRHGANCVGIRGSSYNVITGVYSLADYQARWRRYLDACLAREMWVFATMFDGAFYAVDLPQVEAQATSMAALFSEYPNVVGIDVAVELNQYHPIGVGDGLGDYEVWVEPLAAAVRAGTDIPISFSSAVESAAGFTDAFAAYVMPHCDFADWHPYYTAGDPVTADLAGFRAAGYYKPFIIGECGTNTANETTRRNRWTALKTLQAATDNYGTVFFLCVDYGATSTDQFGMYKTTGQLRSECSNPFDLTTKVFA